MYNIVKNVILTGRYELSSILHKIDVLWLQGDIDDEQKVELEQLARDHADPSMSVDCLKAIEALGKNVKALEARVEALELGNEKPEPEPQPENPDEPNANAEYPAFEKDHAYHNGDKCTCGGKHYVCQLPEYVDTCWFSPEAYPDYWKEVA